MHGRINTNNAGYEFNLGIFIDNIMLPSNRNMEFIKVSRIEKTLKSRSLSEDRKVPRDTKNFSSR